MNGGRAQLAPTGCGGGYDPQNPAKEVIPIGKRRRASINKALEILLENILKDQDQFRRHLVKEDGETVERVFEKYDMTAVSGIVRAVNALEKTTNSKENDALQIILDEESNDYGK